MTFDDEAVAKALRAVQRELREPDDINTLLELHAEWELMRRQDQNVSMAPPARRGRGRPRKNVFAGLLK